MPETSLPSISDIRGWARMRSSSSNRKATPEAVSFSLFNTSCVTSSSRSPAITPPLPCFSSGLNGVALLAGCEENVGPGQPAAIAARGVLVPGTLARIVVERPRQFPDRFELVRQKQPSRFDPGRIGPARSRPCGTRPVRAPPASRAVPARAVEGVHLDERAVVVADIQAEELVVVLQHGRQQRIQPRIIRRSPRTGSAAAHSIFQDCPAPASTASRSGPPTIRRPCR